MRVGTLSLLASLYLSFAPALRTQEHAPTVDVCQADRAAWDDRQERIDYYNQETRHINDNAAENKNPVGKMPIKEINLRIKEMSTCMSVDERNALKYSEIVDFFTFVVKDRYRRFIERHDLMAKFYAEDEAGLR